MATMFKPARAAYQTTPLTSVSDMVFVDSKTKREFSWLGKTYVEPPNKNAEQHIRAYLTAWQQNDALLEPLFIGNKRLMEIQDHSRNLSATAAIGLDALDRIGKRSAPEANWVQQRSDMLGTYEKSHNETELAVIPDIAALVVGHLVAEPAAHTPF